MDKEKKESSRIKTIQEKHTRTKKQESKCLTRKFLQTESIYKNIHVTFNNDYKKIFYGSDKGRIQQEPKELKFSRQPANQGCYKV